MRAADTLMAVSRLGGRLEPAGDTQLRALLPHDCPVDLRLHIRQHKSQLLALLHHDFLVVRSAVLNETVFFAADQRARTALIAAGAQPGCIYTHQELRELVKLHRREPISADLLLRIHNAKREFSGRITST
jgi:hypothetical protein